MFKGDITLDFSHAGGFLVEMNLFYFHINS